MHYKGVVVGAPDGDSMTLAGGVELRLANVNAPEIGSPGAMEAQRYLHHLVFGRLVVFNVVARSYDRFVAEVWLNGVSINEAMRRFLRGG